jgi:cell division protein FtsL
MEVTRVQREHESDIKALELNVSDLSLIRKVVYGTVSLVLVSVASAIIYLVIHK